MNINDYPQTVVDPVMAEVRRHKEEIAAIFNYNVVALGRSLQKREVGDPRFVKSTEVQAAKDQTK